MGKSLIITEKPSVAQEFARCLHVTGRGNGFIENNDYVITWCVGHLVGLVYPESYDMKYKKWKLEDLPFLPQDYKYDVIKEVQSQYNIVHDMLHREDIDRVYWAGDAGKEGQTIEENIRNFGGVREGMEELRVWIDSQTEEEILRGIREAKPMSDYANLGNSGIMRTIEDYAMGINFSRVMSVKYGNLLNDAAATKSYTAIAVGRVMTCVLGMVVNREREIRNFTETPFYRVVGSFSDAGIVGEWKTTENSKYFDSPLLYKENGFKKEESASTFISECSGEKAYVKTIDKGISKKRAPLLFNLAELQAECSKRFKISPDQTLQIAQDLYEKKLTTYPRTDARVLSTAVSKEIYKNISRLKAYDPVTAYVDTIMNQKLYANIAKTQYTDDSKVTDHYAIIPTGQLTELNSLNSLQKSVFDLIVRRFLSIFYPPAEYQTVKLVVDIPIDDKKESFFSSAKVLKSPGYLEIAGIPKKKDNNDPTNPERGLNRVTGGAYSQEEDEEEEYDPTILLRVADSLHQGDEISVSGFQIKEGKTSPPKRYTSGSMVLAMENAGQLIEDEELREQIKGSGIGTSATRAEIIKKLVRIGYINLNQKTQILSPENLGEMVYEVVFMTVPSLLNPEMTASWEKGLEGITQGTVDFAAYRSKLENFIRTETIKMIDQNLREPIADRISNFAGKDAKGLGARRKIGVKCPVCDGEIVTTPFGFGCTNYKADKSGCNFNIGEVAGVTLTDEQVKKLIETGITDTIRGFKSKNGNKFDACLKLNKDETTGKVSASFDFEQVKPLELENLSCPECGGKVFVTPYGYRCENFDRENEMACKFSVGRIADKAISETQLRQLINEGKTDVIKGFKGKSGKRFDAILKLEKDEKQHVNIAFEFEANDPVVIEGVKCPDCGGAISKTIYGYRCENFNRDSADGCKFYLGKIAERDLKEEEFKYLLENGKTETLRDFKGKNGKKFDACLKLEKDENGISHVSFDFENVKPLVLENISCPDCGGRIVVTPYGYRCENLNRDAEDGCKFSVGKIADKAIPESQLRQLIIEGKSDLIKGFKGKTGKKFDAFLKLAKAENGHVNIIFEFPGDEDNMLEGIKCPDCGSSIIKTGSGFRCQKFNREEEAGCKFYVGQVAGKDIKEDVLRQLLSKGKTETIRDFKGKTGKKFDAVLKLVKDESGRSAIHFDFEEVKARTVADVKCPICGGDVMVTPFGFACSNHKRDEEDSCKFTIGKMAEKTLTESHVKQLLTNGKTETIRGFKGKNGKKFDACIALSKDENGKVTGLKFDFEHVEAKKVKDVKCPKCGGDIEVAPFGFVCSNNRRDDPESCRFMVGSIASVKIKEAWLKELLVRGKTDVISGFVGKTGMKFEAPLKLTAEGDITFDFPEKAQPVETEVLCPKCQKKLMRNEWRLTCECGFSVWHTLCKIPLSDEVLTELFTTGKTKNKVLGFTSKSGNVFDTCLRFENDEISFDFDNPGENPSNSEGNGKSFVEDMEDGLVELPSVEGLTLADENFLDAFTNELASTADDVEESLNSDDLLRELYETQE